MKRANLPVDFATGIYSLFQGLGVTLVNFFRPKVTVQYPFAPSPVTPWFRTRLVHLKDPETGRLKCTACQACAIACPDEAITNIGGDEKKGKERRALHYEWDALRCMYCNFCVEACPFDAIVFRSGPGMACYRREEAHFQLEQMIEGGSAAF